jgi:hypothetical protein
MKRILLVIAVIALSLPSKSQFNHFLEVSSHYLIIPGIQQQQEPILFSSHWPTFTGYSIREDYKAQPGFSIQAGREFVLPYNLRLEVGAGISYLRFQRTVKVEVPYQELPDYTSSVITQWQPIGSFYGNYTADTVRFIYPGDSPTPTFLEPSENAGKTGIILVDFPVRLTYPFFGNKIFVGAGLTCSLLAWSSQMSNRLEMDPISGRRQVEYKDTSSNGLTNLLLNADASIRYALSDRFSLVVTYKHGLTPLYDPQARIAGKSYNRNGTLGVRYGL